MDLSPIRDVLNSQSFGKVADVCDELMLKVASERQNFQQEWPYAIHLLGYLYNNDMNSARFLWKSVPAELKERSPEAVAVWSIGQCLWTRDYATVQQAVRGYDWSAELSPFIAAFSEEYRKRMFQLLSSAYSTIGVKNAADFLGMSEPDATSYALQNGWVLDQSSQMLTVKSQRCVSEQKVDPGKLQRLTEYVFHLEH